MTMPADPAQGDPVVTDPASTSDPAVTEPVVTPEPAVPYAKELESLPDSVRPLVEPIFKEWDSNTTKKFQELHSEYEPWKPVTEGYDPETVLQAIQLAQYMENDPAGLIKALQEAYKIEQGPGNQQQQDPANPVDPAEAVDPRDAEIAELREGLGKLAEYLLGNQQQAQLQDANKELDTVLGSLKEKHGDFNEQFVLTLIASGADPEKAVEQYKEAVNAAATAQVTPGQQAPTVVGGGGGTPTEIVDVGALTPQQTKDHVAKLLAAAAAENN